MEKTVYIRMRHRVQVHPKDTVYLHNLAQIIGDAEIYNELKDLPIYHVSESDNSNNIIIIDLMQVIKMITKVMKDVEVQAIGPSQTIIEVVFKKKGVSIPLFLLIWFLLFFGSALAIMNFHEDVSMHEVHERLYTIITGKVEEKPLLFQIPYSVGLGLGMIIFFNHVFRKRLNEEPSPLEIEMFNYQQDLDQYVIMNENKESITRLHDDD
ncbi:stage V sporulation protein AA [Bacillus dakarensis]|uniref:stage V sporulation protein AA n=1 Tax=Robertmurraya dakarensis TaxID=1926278 RepID=UPI0009814FAA|nr:stage V sporulation protein AA [Bacillus dakarensis]